KYRRVRQRFSLGKGSQSLFKKPRLKCFKPKMTGTQGLSCRRILSLSCRLRWNDIACLRERNRTHQEHADEEKVRTHQGSTGKPKIGSVGRVTGAGKGASSSRFPRAGFDGLEGG